MSSEHQPDGKRRKKALAILALVWTLFGVYLVGMRKQEPELPRVGVEVGYAVNFHMQCENTNAFSRPPVFSDAVIPSDAIAGRRKISK